MVSLFFRNLLFTILQPGIVVGLIPFLIIRKKINAILAQSLLHRHYLGIFFFVIGFVVMITCIVSFAVKGRGTLSPADPTKRLVTTGLYNFSRNPMYVGMMMILVGEAIFFQSNYLWIYSFGAFTSFNIFILFIEEPRLENFFGEEYNLYRKKVRRWI